MVILNFLDSIYSKLPEFSTEIKQFIVRVLPFIAVVAGIVITFSSVVDLIGTPFLSAVSTTGGATIFQRLMIVNILGLIEGIILIVSFYGLRKKQRIGWRLVFWSQVVFILSALLSFSPSFILGFLFFYPLFQIRHSYR